MRSIAQRLTIGLITLAVLAGISAIFVVHHLQNKLLIETVSINLHENMEGLIGSLRLKKFEITHLDTRMQAIYRSAYSGRYYLIKSSTKEIRSRSLWDTTLEFPLLFPGDTEQWTTQGPRGEQMLVLAQGINFHGQEVTLVIAENLEPYSKYYRRATGSLIIIIFGSLLVLFLSHRIIVSHSFKPVQKMRQALQDLADGKKTDLDDNVPDEFAPLTAAMNQLLKVTEEQITRSRNSIGNLGHALKTPISVLKQQIENHVKPKQPELADKMMLQLNSILNLTEKKLVQARVAGDVLPSAAFNVETDLSSLLSMLETIYQAKGVTVKKALSSTPEKLPINREDGLEMFGNVLDNAFKWAESTIKISIETSTRDCRICIEDDGPGVPQAEIVRVLTRGQRLDEQTPGHGLGMSIIQEIADIYQAKLTLAKSQQLGGLALTLSFSLSKQGFLSSH